MNKNFLLCLASILFAYVLLEFGLTALFSPAAPETYWVWSNDRTITFDPVAGFRLTREEAYRSRITKGQVEYCGVYRGNNRGFADRDNFVPERTIPAEKLPRYAVFGDSFSHAQYNPHNWPDHAEDLLFDAGRPTQLLNFALDGQGLANWWSILRGEIEKRNYQIDGVIFAVFEDNLFRPFTMIHMNAGKLYLGRLPYWNAERTPKSFAEASRYMPEVKAAHLLDRRNFFRALSGEWTPPVEREWFLLGRMRKLLGRILPPAPLPAPPGLPEDCGPETNEPWRQRMVDEIATIVRRHKWKAIVVYLPSRDDLLAHGKDTFHRSETRRFAEKIGAEFHDSTSLYEALDEADIRGHFLPYDGHWNTEGSDIFAEFMFDLLTRQGRDR